MAARFALLGTLAKRCSILLIAFTVSLCAVPTHATLLDYWRFNEISGSSAADVGTNGLNLTLNNGPTFSAGQLGNAISFDGVNDYGSNSGAPFTTDQNHTVSFWTNVPTSPVVDTKVLIAWGATGARYLLQLDNSVGANDNDGRWIFSVGNAPLGKFTNASALPVANTWQQWSMVRSGTGASLYLNGNLLETITVAPANGAITENGSTDLNVGKQRTDVGNIQNFQGKVDDLAIWSRALSASESKSLYSFATTAGLLYDTGNVDQLLTIYQNQTGTLALGGLTWRYVTGLNNSLTLGQVTAAGGGNYNVRLDNTNAGLTTVPVPEPASLSIMLIGLILGARALRRHPMI